MPSPPLSGFVVCPKCRRSLHQGVGDFPAGTECPGCRSQLQGQSFPALLTIPSRAEKGAEAMPGEATCYFHPVKKAAGLCERCGRFLCALCDLPLGGRHLCPSCLESGLAQRSHVPELVLKRVNWGDLALSVAFWPLGFVIFWPMLVSLFLTAPAAIFLALYGWRKPGSLIRGRRHGAAVAAILLALLEIGALGSGVVLIYLAMNHG